MIDTSSQLPRKGRPSIEVTGLIDERVLSVATSLFLEYGYGRTTLDLVSKQSSIGKSALYRRYHDKEALFAAVVQESIKTMFAHMALPDGMANQEQRLQLVGEELIKGILHPRCVAFMRITAAEACNFHELAKMAYKVSFDDSASYVASVLEDAVLSGEYTATEVAQRFVEVAVQPLSFQAAFGIDPELLMLRKTQSVREAIILLKATGYIIL